MRDKAPDWLEDAMTQAPQWEPPPGFALRVASASREQHAPLAPTLRGERLLLGRWCRAAVVEAIRSRLASSVWVLRQYRSALRG
jgi:hypothetical protein